MIPQELIAAVGKLLREQPRNPTAIEVSEALKAALEQQSNSVRQQANKAPFDKKAYQRDLMRKRRAEEKRKKQQADANP